MFVDKARSLPQSLKSASLRQTPALLANIRQCLKGLEETSNLANYETYDCKKFYDTGPCGLYYKPIMIIISDACTINIMNDASRIVIDDTPNCGITH
jgi:hypothetical protein